MSITIPGGTTVVTRGECGLRAPRGRTAMSARDGSTIHYNGPKVNIARLLSNHELCYYFWRGTQNFHMDGRGWQDVAYTCGVCPHGVVFEGRWLHTRTAAQGTNTGNATSYAIYLFVGEGETPTADQMSAAWDVAAYLRARGGAGANIRPHRYWHSTACPGDNLTNWIAAGFNRPNGPINNTGDEVALTPEEHDLLVSIDQELKGVGEAFGAPRRPPLRELITLSINGGKRTRRILRAGLEHLGVPAKVLTDAAEAADKEND